MKLHGYATREEYVITQVEGNRRKLDRVWAQERNIREIALAITLKLRDRSPRFGICHGTRRGLEQAWFMKYLPGCQVIGTEISPSALLFANTVQHDFQEERAGWVGKADFVYSNSLDHAMDPRRTLAVWRRQLTSGGVLVLEHSDYHEVLTDYNCFAATVEETRALLLQVFGPSAAVSVHPLPVRPLATRRIEALVVRNA